MFKPRQRTWNILPLLYQPRQTLSEKSLIASTYQCQPLLFAESLLHIQLTVSTLPPTIMAVGYMCCGYGQDWKRNVNGRHQLHSGQVAPEALPENLCQFQASMERVPFTTAFITPILSPSSLPNWLGLYPPMVKWLEPKNRASAL